MLIRVLAVLGVAILAAVLINSMEDLGSHKETVSYALGMQSWKRLRQQPVAVDPEYYVMGFMDALSGRGTLLSEAESRAILERLSTAAAQDCAPAATQQPAWPGLPGGLAGSQQPLLW